MSRKSPLIIGVTGGIGSGKSLVCAVLASFGVPVFNADHAARKAYTDPVIQQKVMMRFGEDVFEQGQLNTKRMAERLFGNADALTDIAAIVHPFVKDAFARWVSQQSRPYVVREAAILIESGAYHDCDEIVLVTAPDRLRYQRIIRRDGSTAAEVDQRLKSQWNDDQKVRFAHRVWVNDEKHLLLPSIYAAHVEWSRG